jgi:uncharacterized protein YndB with AHSA1/START domain
MRPEDQAPATLTITVERLIDAPRAEVYHNWLRAADLAAWFAPDGYEVTRSEVDARVGGRWLVEYRSERGEAYREFGEFRELIEPERLVLTLTQQPPEGTSGPETTLTVTLHERGQRTLMVFEQKGLTSTSMRDGNAQGWRECFIKLDRHLMALRDAT